MTQPTADRQSIEQLFPIVRCRRRWWGKHDLLYVGSRSLVIGSVKAEISEEFLQALAESNSCASLVLVPQEQIPQVQRDRYGYLSPSTCWTRYTIQTQNKTYRFWIQNHELGNVDRGLRFLLGERFVPCVFRRLSITERVLVAMVILAVPCLALSWWHWTVLVLSAGITAWGMRDLRDSVRAKASRPARNVRKGPAGRAPFRSATLGWILKVAGIAWVILLFLSGANERLVVGSILKDNLPAYVLGVLIYGALYLPGFEMLWRGYRMCLRSFAPGHHPDTRAPILYLRGFDDDGCYTFQPANSESHGVTGSNFDESSSPIKARRFFIWSLHPIKLLRMFLSADRSSAEEVLACAFRNCGPLVAIGQPGEKLATPGADRMYVSDEVWQQVVLDYLDRCHAVVCQPSNSEGILWEVEQVFSRVKWHRILLSMRHFRHRPDEYEDFRTWLAEKFGLRLPLSVPFVDGPCFIYFEIDNRPRLQRICHTSPWLWSFTNNAVDVPNTFHSFIQGLDGGPRESPRSPRNRPIQALISLLIPATLFFILLFGVYLFKNLL